MGDCWDYKMQKVKIAWELAQRSIKRRSKKATGMSNEQYRKMQEEELAAAWNAVNSTLPCHEKE